VRRQESEGVAGQAISTFAESEDCEEERAIVIVDKGRLACDSSSTDVEEPVGQ
jgi:hypothetical protein